MKRSRWHAVKGIFLAALLSSPVWGSIPPQPGTINYIEGQAAIGAQRLNGDVAGSAKLGAGQSLSTQDGRAEVLLTPGVFLRLNGHSAVQMVSPDLANTTVMLQKGRAMVEVDYIRPENNIRITVDNHSIQLQKKGLYDFDADRNLVRVFDGEAAVFNDPQRIELKSGHELALQAQAPMKAHKFDKKGSETDDFFRWASLRSSYLADANMDAARTYAGGAGWAPTTWAGAGWYWDPWFTSYTFIPGDGLFYSPFGWGFYSPWYVPYFGYSGFYGGYPYYRHFGRGYRPPQAVTAARGYARGGGFVGRAPGVRGGFSSGGFHGATGGFHGGGGGFHGAAGGFHGGGGRR